MTAPVHKVLAMLLALLLSAAAQAAPADRAICVDESMEIERGTWKLLPHQDK